VIYAGDVTITNGSETLSYGSSTGVISPSTEEGDGVVYRSELYMRKHGYTNPVVRAHKDGERLW